MGTTDFDDTKYCIARGQAVREYKEKWPNYCLSCGGWGAQMWVEDHGLAGRGAVFSKPCECVINGTCPRCGAKDVIDEDGSGPCPECDWDHDGGMPQY